jgi:hypothetical protein
LSKFTLAHFCFIQHWLDHLFSLLNDFSHFCLSLLIFFHFSSLSKKFLRCGEQIVLVSSLQLFNRSHALLLRHILVHFSLIGNFLLDLIFLRFWKILSLLKWLALLTIHSLEHLGLISSYLFSFLHFTGLLLIFLLLHQFLNYLLRDSNTIPLLFNLPLSLNCLNCFYLLLFLLFKI